MSRDRLLLCANFLINARRVQANIASVCGQDQITIGIQIQLVGTLEL